MEIVPLSPIPSQTLAVTLGTQKCRLNVYERRGYGKRDTLIPNKNSPLLRDGFGRPVRSPSGDGISVQDASFPGGSNTQVEDYTFPIVFVDLYVDDIQVVAGMQAHHGVALVPDIYLGFTGYLAFVDLQGNESPNYKGLGDRWILVYFPDNELLT